MRNKKIDIFIFFTIWIILSLFFYLAHIMKFMINYKSIDDINNVLFTTTGIIFSVGFSIILGFDLSQIKNKKSLEDISNKLKVLKDYALFVFFMSLLFFIISKIISIDYIKFNPIIIKNFTIDISVFLQTFFVSILLYSIFGLSINFSVLYDEKIEIAKIISKELKDKQ